MISYAEAAHEIANKGKSARDRFTIIGEMFENMGVIRSAVVRTSDRGRKGTRHFMSRFGEPLIGSACRPIVEAA